MLLSHELCRLIRAEEVSMKKRYFMTITCAAVFALWITGCGGGGSAAETTQAATTVATTAATTAAAAAKDDGKGDVLEEPAVNAEDFYGIWEYETDDVFLYIYGDGTLEWFDEDGESEVYNYYMEDGELCIEGSNLRYRLDGEGGMYDNDDEYLFISELPDFESDSEFTGNAEDFFGCWKYRGEDYWIYFYGNGTFETLNANGPSMSGTYHMEDDGSLYVNEQEWVFTFTEDGMVDNYGDYLDPSEWPDGTERERGVSAYVLEEGIDVDYELNSGNVTVDGAAFYFERGSEGTGFNTCPLQISVDLEKEEEFDNGYTERTLTAYFGVSEDYTPDFSNGITTGCKYMFYDAYTGTFLPDTEYFEGGNGPGSYYFEFETPQGWVDLYIYQNNEIHDDAPGYTHIFTSSITVVAPSWYDGLVLTIPVQPDTYEGRLEYTGFTETLESFISMDNQPYNIEDGFNCLLLY